MIFIRNNSPALIIAILISITSLSAQGGTFGQHQVYLKGATISPVGSYLRQADRTRMQMYYPKVQQYQHPGVPLNNRYSKSQQGTESQKNSTSRFFSWFDGLFFKPADTPVYKSNRQQASHTRYPYNHKKNNKINGFRLPQLESKFSPSSSDIFYSGAHRTTTNLVNGAVQESIVQLRGPGQSGWNNNRLANSLTQDMASTVQQVLHHSDIDALRRIEVGAGISSEGDPRFSLHTVQPLSDIRQTDHNTFFQGGLSYEALDGEDRTTLNLGLGYRYLTPDQKRLYGVNAFYDHEYPYDHRRLGFGLEMESSLWRAGLNHYHGLSDWQNSEQGWQEKALDGTDVTVAGRLPHHPEWELALTAYDWNQTEGESDISGNKATLKYQPFRALTLNLGLDQQNGQSADLTGGLKFKYILDMPLVEQMKPVSKMELFSVKNRRFRSVERENHIRVQSRQNPATVATIDTSGGNLIDGRVANDGDTVRYGQTIEVGPNPTDQVPNWMILNFNDGAKLSINEGSSVVIQDGLIHLISGYMEYTSGDGVSRTLTTPNAIVTLIGTTVTLFDDNSGDVALKVTEGKAKLEVADTVLILNENEVGCSTNGAPALCAAGNTVYNKMAEASAQLQAAIESPSVNLELTNSLAEITNTAASRLIPAEGGEKFEFTITSSPNQRLEIDVEGASAVAGDWIAASVDEWGNNPGGNLVFTTDSNGKAVVVVDLHLGGDYTVRVAEEGGSAELDSQVISLVDSLETVTLALTQSMEGVTGTATSRQVPSVGGEKFEFTISSSPNLELEMDVSGASTEAGDWIAASEEGYGQTLGGNLVFTTDSNGIAMVVVDLHLAGDYTVRVFEAGGSTVLATQLISLVDGVSAASSASITLTSTLDEVTSTLDLRPVPVVGGEKFEFTIESQPNVQLDVEVVSLTNSEDWVADGLDTASWNTNNTGSLTVTTDSSGQAVVVVDLHDAGSYTIDVKPNGSTDTLDSITVELFGQIHNGHVYDLVTTAANWASASAAADANGGYLAIIDDDAENAFVFDLISSVTTTASDGGGAKYAWLGGSDRDVEGTWKWVDATNLDSGYENWGQAEPDDYPADTASSQNCLAMGVEDWPIHDPGSYGSASQWNDISCSNSLSYVIEYPD